MSEEKSSASISEAALADPPGPPRERVKALEEVDVVLAAGSAQEMPIVETSAEAKFTKTRAPLASMVCCLAAVYGSERTKNVTPSMSARPRARPPRCGPPS